MTQAPDVFPVICADLYVGDLKKPVTFNLAVLAILGSGVFTFEHPDQAKDLVAVSLAGLKSVLAAYRSAVHRGMASSPALEVFLEHERARTLPDHVREKTASCFDGRGRRERLDLR
jgi:hypothetical protein